MLILIGISAYYGWNSYHKAPEQMTSRKTDMSMNANDLLARFQNDTQNAMLDLSDKNIEVSGNVNNTSIEGGTKTVYISTNDAMALIACEMEASEDISGISEGDAVNIKGQCTGYLGDDMMAGDVVMVRCIMKK